MTIIKRNALVSYTSRQMFELVDAVEEYPRFLPWCRSSHIISRSDTEVEASLEITWSGMHKTFTTRNHLYHHERIDISLVSGPFKHLEGRWSFVPLGDQGCKVHMELEFEFTGHIFDKLFQPVFNHIANSLVDAFVKRALEVYGTR